MITIDLETFAIAPGRLAPPIVCAQWGNEHEQHLITHSRVSDWFRWLFTSGATINGFNIAYDLACLCAHDSSLIPLIFDMLDNGRVVDASIALALHDIGTTGGALTENKRIKLEATYHAISGESIKGKGTTQLHYQSLYHVSISLWPQEAITYAKRDIVAAASVWNHYAALQHLYTPPSAPSGMPSQVRAAFALQFQSARGLCTDRRMWERVRLVLLRQREQALRVLISAGIVRADGSQADTVLRNLAEQTAEYAGVKLSRTPGKGLVQVDAYAKKRLAKHSPVFQALLDHDQADDHLGKYLRPMILGLDGNVIHPNYTVCVGSNRVSSWEPNIQNQSNKVPIRECFVPRPGYAFVAADLNMAELVSVSEMCLHVMGASRMGQWINDGKDAHLAMIAATQGIVYEQLPPDAKKVLKRERELYKGLNFGRPGKMGIGGLIAYWFTRGLEVSYSEARTYMNRWDQAMPEVGILNEWTMARVAQNNGVYVHPLTGWVRYVGDRDGAACNNNFQTLTATGVKHATYEIARECYHPDIRSSLKGSYPVAMVHDENLLEIPLGPSFTAAGYRAAEIMTQVTQRYTPHVRSKSSPVAQLRWSKRAEMKTLPDGTLVAYDPIVHLGEEYRL